uniref:Uncharacterized protein n=1 Tax=Anguilla anguilla TaxID=7936 RepID=A0A0E9XUD9_ANGAN
MNRDVRVRNRNIYAQKMCIHGRCPVNPFTSVLSDYGDLSSAL